MAEELAWFGVGVGEGFFWQCLPPTLAHADLGRMDSHPSGPAASYLQGRRGSWGGARWPPGCPSSPGPDFRAELSGTARLLKRHPRPFTLRAGPAGCRLAPDFMLPSSHLHPPLGAEAHRSLNGEGQAPTPPVTPASWGLSELQSWSPRINCGSVRHQAPLSSNSEREAALVEHLLCAGIYTSVDSFRSRILVTFKR